MAITLITNREKEVLNSIIDIIKEIINPEKIYIFGSRVKGTASFFSDFDIGIEDNTPDIEKLELLKEMLDDKAGLYSIDLVFLKDAEINFANLIRNYGIVIYEK